MIATQKGKPSPVLDFLLGRKANIMKEIWKDITGYEGLYQVSNLGRIRNVKSFKILKQSHGVDGYLQLCLTKNSKKSTKKVHRLVAQAFIENINNYETIDHIDCNKTNNNVNNLEWCTREENIKRAWKNGIIKSSNCFIERNNSNKKKIEQYTLDGQFVKTFDCINDAIKEYKNKNIQKVISGKRKIASGYIWKLAK